MPLPVSPLKFSRVGAALRSTIAALVLPALACASALAAGYPEKPVRIVVPTTQGGGADTLARHIGTRPAQ